MKRFTICHLCWAFLCCLFFAIPKSWGDFEEVSIIFNPKVQFEYSDSGIRPNFYQEGNGPFTPFKAKGRMSGNVFVGNGTGTIGKGKDAKTYTCKTELTLDPSMSRIDHFAIAVDIVQYKDTNRQDFTSAKYRIKGHTMPLSNISHYTDFDTLMYVIKGPLAKKQIDSLTVDIQSKTRKQIAKNQWAPVTYWRKSVDYNLSPQQGIFIMFKGKAVAQALTFDDSPFDLYDLEKESDIGVARPTLDFNLTMVDKKAIDPAPSALKLIFDATAVIDSPFYGKDKHQSQVAVFPLIKPNRYEWKSEMALEFRVPLYEVLSQVYKGIEVHDHLTEKQFRPIDPKGIPEITTLTLDLKLVSAEYKSIKDKSSQPIQLPLGTTYQKKYSLGTEVDLAKVTKLKVGEAHSIDWHDITGLAITTGKFFTQADKVEMMLTVTDCLVQAHGGYMSASDGNYIGAAESAGGIANTAIGKIDRFKNKSTMVGLVFTLPQIYRLTVKEFWGLPVLIRKVEAGLHTLGYYPISDGRVTKDFPIWVNPEQQRLAMIDPAGLVHPVKRPDNFHISWAFFRLQGTRPEGKPLLFRSFTENGWSPWWTLGGPLVKQHKILPPLQPHFPLRMKLPTPAEYTEKVQRSKGFGSVRSVSFGHSEGSRITLERGEDYDGIVDFGWEDRDNPLVFEKPYITLVSGRLRVKDEASRVGIGFYREMNGERSRYQPQLWCEPVGTEYVIDFNPATGACKIEVLEGRVTIRDSQSRIVDHIETGRTGTFSIPMEDYLKEVLEQEEMLQETPHSKRPVQQDQEVHPAAAETTATGKADKPVQQKTANINYTGILLPQTSDQLIVVNTFPGSPARKAGLMSGDRLLTMDGRNLSGLTKTAFESLIQSSDPNARHVVQVKRGKQRLTIPLPIAALPPARIEEILDKHEKEADPIYNEAQALKQKGQYKRAQPLYAKVIDLKPTHTISYDAQAYCLDKTGRRHLAYPLLQMSLLLEDKMYNNYLYGKFLNHDGQYRQAVTYLEKATAKVNSESNFYFPFKELGEALFILDDRRAAAKAFLASEKLGDKSEMTIGTLALCLEAIGQERKAIIYYRRYLALDSHNQRMYQTARSRLSVLERKYK